MTKHLWKAWSKEPSPCALGLIWGLILVYFSSSCLPVLDTSQ